MCKTIEELKAQTRPTMKGNRVRGNSRLSKGYERKVEFKKNSEPASYAAMGMDMSYANISAMQGISAAAQQHESMAIQQARAASQQQANYGQGIGAALGGFTW